MTPSRANGARLRILYLGRESGTSLDRAHAYRRLGHEVRHVDLRRLLAPTVWVDRLAWRVGGAAFGPWIAARLARALEGSGRYDLCHVDGGEWVTPGVIATLRGVTDCIVNYNIDDPLGQRDGRHYASYRQSLPLYDLAVVMREQNVAEARAAGARKVLRVFMSADEVTHAPRLQSDAQRAAWHSEVLFVGTWMPERGPFLVNLVRRGVPLVIRGARWHKAPEWPLLERHWVGDAVWGDEYAQAIQGARISLGLLSKGNRDLHTTRSMEVPALGGLLCAERTSEHLALYAEGEEAVFWRDAAECAQRCHELLADEALRLRIARRGQQRLHRNGHLNEVMLASVLEAAGQHGRGRPTVRHDHSVPVSAA